MSAYPKVRDAGTANRGRFLRVLSTNILASWYMKVQSMSHTHAKQASEDQSCEQQGEANGELLLLGD
jgi:hypothetical protein